MHCYMTIQEFYDANRHRLRPSDKGALPATSFKNRCRKRLQRVYDLPVPVCLKQPDGEHYYHREVLAYIWNDMVRENPYYNQEVALT